MDFLRSFFGVVLTIFPNENLSFSFLKKKTQAFLEEHSLSLCDYTHFWIIRLRDEQKPALRGVE